MSDTHVIDGLMHKIVDPQKFKWRVMGTSFVAYAFDIADFMAIALTIPMLMKLWGISLVTAGLLGTTALIGWR